MLATSATNPGMVLCVVNDHAETMSMSAAVAAVASSPELGRRELRRLPVDGPDAPVTETQGRGPSEATSAEGLADLASSIATHGLLQPILVEDRNPGLVVVAGERRFRAFQMAVRARPDAPHLRDGIPAYVVAGPVPEEDRRAWQVAENLCRADLAPGEFGAALLFERCAVLRSKLVDAGIDVPDEDATWPDPVQRWERLERVRVQAEAHHIGAPWPEVIGRLGINLSEAGARKVVRALAALPDGLAEEMDAEGVALSARMDWIRLAKTRKQAAAELWDAVRNMGRPDLLSLASKAALADPAASTEEAIGRAEAVHESADQNRARLVADRWASTNPTPDPAPHTDQSESRPNVQASPVSSGANDHAPLRRDMPQPTDTDPAEASVAATVPVTETSDAAIAALQALVDELRAGRRPSKYDAGSLRLLAQEVLRYVAGDDTTGGTVNEATSVSS